MGPGFARPYAITVFSEIVHQLSNENQIIISTHSVELLNEFDADGVIKNRCRMAAYCERRTDL